MKVKIYSVYDIKTNELAARGTAAECAAALDYRDADVFRKIAQKRMVTGKHTIYRAEMEEVERGGKPKQGKPEAAKAARNTGCTTVSYCRGCFWYASREKTCDWTFHHSGLRKDICPAGPGCTERLIKKKKRN